MGVGWRCSNQQYCQTDMGHHVGVEPHIVILEKVAVAIDSFVVLHLVALVGRVANFFVDHRHNASKTVINLMMDNGWGQQWRGRRQWHGRGYVVVVILALGSFSTRFIVAVMMIDNFGGRLGLCKDDALRGRRLIRVAK